jgi:hypothetical protein
VWMKTKKKKNAKLFCRQAALILSLFRHLRRWSMYQRQQVYLNFPPQKAWQSQRFQRERIFDKRGDPYIVRSIGRNILIQLSKFASSRSFAHMKNRWRLVSPWTQPKRISLPLQLLLRREIHPTVVHPSPTHSALHHDLQRSPYLETSTFQVLPREKQKKKRLQTPASSSPKCSEI